jgi:hypothetical protein
MFTPKRQVSTAASIPAPIGGWNARDALGEMEPTDAVKLENFWVLPSGVAARKGFSQYSTGLGDQVESIFSYSSPTVQKLFGVAGDSIFDCTAGGAVGTADVSGLTNARFQYINMSTSGGSFLLAVNGAEKLQGFDGTNWWVDGDGAHDITGFDTAKAIHINLFKTRPWLIEKDSLKVWYLGVNSIAGAANALDFSSIARKGGYLVGMGTWTIDAGYGVDDLAVFITSQGEVIVYRGTDPTSASTWALVGVWNIGAPIGRRCFFKWSGDLLLITQDGVVPLSGALQSSRVNPKVALTDKIQSAMSAAATLYGSNYGWQLFYYAKANMLLLNVPVGNGSIQEQFAMNTITKAWCNFKNISSNCWELFNDEPYFGGDGYIGKFWNSLDDNGSNITTTCKQAFNYFESRGKLKRFTMMRPMLLTNGNPSILGNLNIDFQDDAPTSLLSFAATSGSVWDTSTWDNALWGGDDLVQKVWQGATGIGYCASVRIQTASQGINVQLIATDVVYETGAIL